MGQKGEERRGEERPGRKMDGAAWRDTTHGETESNSRPAGAVLSAPAASCRQQCEPYTSSPFVSPAIVTNVSANTSTCSTDTSTVTSLFLLPPSLIVVDDNATSVGYSL